MAADEFRHSLQHANNSVADFIWWIEKTYEVAYGKVDLNTATRDAILSCVGVFSKT